MIFYDSFSDDCVLGQAETARIPSNWIPIRDNPRESASRIASADSATLRVIACFDYDYDYDDDYEHDDEHEHDIEHEQEHGQSKG